MINFFVPGIPRPGGSKTAGRTKTGKLYVRDSSKHAAEWKQQVAYFARKAYDGELLTGALILSVDFYMPRPKNHFRTGKNAGQLKVSAPFYPITKPDLVKLTRSTEDAMTGIIYRDDAIIIAHELNKYYADGNGPVGARIIIENAEDGRF